MAPWLPAVIVWSLLVPGAAGMAGPAGPGPAGHAACGAHLAVRLVPMADRYEGRFREVSDLFTPSPDSTAWFGPVRPNPHSWLSPSVYCREVADFMLDVASDEGEHLDSLRFEGVAPGFYRLGLQRAGESRIERCRLRFRRGEVVIWESTLVLPGEDQAERTGGPPSRRAGRASR